MKCNNLLALQPAVVSWLLCETSISAKAPNSAIIIRKAGAVSSVVCDKCATSLSFVEPGESTTCWCCAGQGSAAVVAPWSA